MQETRRQQGDHATGYGAVAAPLFFPAPIEGIGVGACCPVALAGRARVVLAAHHQMFYYVEL